MVVLFQRGLRAAASNSAPTKPLLVYLASSSTPFTPFTPTSSNDCQRNRGRCDYNTHAVKYRDYNLLSNLLSPSSSLSSSSILGSNNNHRSNVNRNNPFQNVHVQIKAIHYNNQLQQKQKQKHPQIQQIRSYSSSTPKLQNSSSEESETTRTLIYEGPFASLSHRLKRISITTAIISIVGVPLLVTFHSGDVPASGQFAVGATAIIAATGSTAALSYCFSPYVKTLSYISINDDSNDSDGNGNGDGVSGGSNTHTGKSTKLVEATTTNLFAMEKITTFNPDTDVSLPSKTSTYRPFCNFMVKGEPFFIHPNLLHDEELKVKLLGDKEETLVKVHDTESDEKKKKLKKDLDDDFL